MTRVTVPVPGSFRLRPTLLSHGWAQLPPFALDGEVTALARIERLRDGAVVRLTVRSVPGGEGGEALEVRVAGLPGAATAGRQREIATAVRRIFHLDLDLEPFYERLRGEPGYNWVERSGAGRLLRSPTVWEDLAKTLMTTNTTWGATRGMVRRICELGEPYRGDAGDDGPRHAFPGPDRIAALDPGDLAARIRAGYRTPYLHELATAIAEGRLEVEAWADGELPAAELLSRIRALKGFGPYAAGTVLKLLGGYGELALDTAARSMFSRRYKGGGEARDAEIRAHYERWGEWRGLVLWMDLLHEALGDRIAAG